MADVCVLPSKGPGETWGLSVNEAMANGKVIIASDKCGCTLDLVQEDKNRFIFKLRSIEDLKCFLKKISSLKKEELLSFKKMSKQIIGNYTFNKVAKQIESTVNGRLINVIK